jgi:hypothetical protein
MFTEILCVTFLANSIRIEEDTILGKYTRILVADGNCNWKRIVDNLDISY